MRQNLGSVLKLKKEDDVTKNAHGDKQGGVEMTRSSLLVRCSGSVTPPTAIGKAVTARKVGRVIRMNKLKTAGAQLCEERATAIIPSKPTNPIAMSL